MYIGRKLEVSLTDMSQSLQQILVSKQKRSVYFWFIPYLSQSQRVVAEGVKALAFQILGRTRRKFNPVLGQGISTFHCFHRYRGHGRNNKINILEM